MVRTNNFVICDLLRKSSDLSFRFTIQNKLTLLICGLTSKPSDLSFRFTIKKGLEIKSSLFFIKYCLQELLLLYAYY